MMIEHRFSGLRPILLAATMIGSVLALDTRPAAAFETIAQEAYMIDATTHAVLLDKNGEKPVPPSSMSKMMTVYDVFDRIKHGQLSLDQKFHVSEKAWRKGGSKMFVKVNDYVSVADLLRGIIIDSGNDATIVIAEGIAGSVEAFAKILNEEAKKIGLKDSHFVNASGWPVPGHVMSARDIATLALRTIKDFPKLYEIYSEKDFTYNGIHQGNRNPLLYHPESGADGLKTGHTEVAGYGLAASAVRDGRRLILVLNGLPDMQARADESRRVLNWGFNFFDNYELFHKGDTVATAEVWLGDSKTVPLVIGRDLTVTLPSNARKEAKIAVNYTGPIPAPIKKGTQLATLTITAPDMKPIEVPLTAGKDVGRLGFAGRISAGVRYLLWGTVQ